MHYQVVRTDDHDRGPWKVRTAAYNYALFDAGVEFLSYHWHPEHREEESWITYPHLHVRAQGTTGRLIQKAHLPTNRIALEDVLRLAISELNVTPRRKDWNQVLTRTQSAYEKWRTWS